MCKKTKNGFVINNGPAFGLYMKRVHNTHNRMWTTKTKKGIKTEVRETTHRVMTREKCK